MIENENYKKNPFDDNIENKDLNNENEEEIEEKVANENEEVDNDLSIESDEIEKEEQSNYDYEELQKKYDNLNNQYVRLAADFDNYRKRQVQEREQLLSYGLETALSKMIEVLDNFERAKKTMENVEKCEDVVNNFNILHKQLIQGLEKLGLEKIETENQTFDPNFHEAVMQTPSSEYEDHTIIAELQKGYKLKDKVLRPSLVNVAVSE